METRDAHPYRNSVRVALIATALAALPLTSFAGFGDQIWWRSSHNTFAAEVSRAAGVPHSGIQYLGTPASAGSGIAARGLGVSHVAGQWPDLKAGSKLPTVQRSPVIDVSARVVPASAAGAIVRAGLRFTGVVGVGFALYELGQEVNFRLSRPAPGGDLVAEKASPVVCSTAPCYQYRGNALANRPWDYSPVAACQLHSSLSGATYIGISGSGASVYCQNSMTTFLMLSQAAPVQTPTYSPATMQELTDAIAAKSGWPSGSKISQAVAEAVKAGETIQTQTPTVTGPATSPAEKRVTTKPDGSVVTTNTTNNYNYNTNVVTVTQTTTTTTYNPSTGATETETTETEPETEEDECAKNPDSLACAEADVPDGEIPRETREVTYAEENLFGSGSCPANLTASVATLGQAVTVWDWQRTCELALPLRALVLSLATFAALLIVMPGGEKA